MEIIRRYKNNVEKIHTGESDGKVQIKEIAVMLDLLRAFFLINFQRNTTDAKNMGLFKMFIIDKIKLIYG